MQTKRILTTALIGLSNVLMFDQALALDLALKGSIVSARVQSDVATEAFSLSGFAPTLMIIKDNPSNWSFGVLFQSLLNTSTQEVSRMTIASAIEYRLFGQARNVDETYKYASLKSHGGQALSVLIQTGGSKYNVSIPTTKKVIAGDSMYLMSGFGYRVSMNQSLAVGAEFLTTIASFSASAQHLKARETQQGLYLQFEF